MGKIVYRLYRIVYIILRACVGKHVHSHWFSRKTMHSVCTTVVSTQWYSKWKSTVVVHSIYPLGRSACGLQSANYMKYAHATFANDPLLNASSPWPEYLAHLQLLTFSDGRGRRVTIKMCQRTWLAGDRSSGSRTVSAGTIYIVQAETVRVPARAVHSRDTTLYFVPPGKKVYYARTPVNRNSGLEQSSDNAGDNRLSYRPYVECFIF